MKKLLTAILFLIVPYGYSQSAGPVPFVKAQYFDSSGNPLVRGKLCTYASGSSTPLTTYQNNQSTVANTNPILLDVAGRADVYLTLDVSYKLVLRTAGSDTTCATGTVVWAQDNILVASSSGSGGGGGGSGTGTINTIGKFTSTTNIGDSRLIDDGTHITFNIDGTGGTTDAVSYGTSKIRAEMRLDDNPSANAFGIGHYVNINNAAGTASYEKGAAIFWTQTADDSSYTGPSCLYCKDAVGLDTRAVLFTPTNGRAFGIETQAEIYSSSYDGYLVGIESGVVNNATADQAQIDTINSKVGIGLVGGGTTPSTAAVIIGGTPGWHKGIVARASALYGGTTDSFLEILNSGDNGGLFRVKADGSMMIGSNTQDNYPDIPLQVVKSNTNGTSILTRNSGATTTSFASFVARTGVSGSTIDLTAGATAAAFSALNGFSPLQGFITSGVGATAGLVIHTQANAPIIFAVNNGTETGRWTTEPFLKLSGSYTGGTAPGAGNVGLRNNAGTIEFANGAGSWTPIGTSSGMTGAGTTNRIPKLTAAAVIGDSILYDDGTSLLLGLTTSTSADHAIESVRSRTNANAFVVRNSNTGVATAYASLVARVGAANLDTAIGVASATSSYTGIAGSSGFIRTGADASGGLVVQTAAGPVIFESGGTATTFKLNTDGGVQLASSSAVGVSGALVFRYNAGTSKAQYNENNAGWNDIAGASGLTGSGTSGFLTKFTSGAIVGNSLLYDDGTSLILGSSSATADDSQIHLETTRSVSGGGELILSRNSNTGAAAYSGFVARSGAGGSTIDATLAVTSASYGTVGNIGPNTGVIRTGAGTTGGLVLQTSSGVITLQPGSAESFRAFASGNISIGSTADSGFKLDVFGTGRYTGQLNASAFVGNGAGLNSLSATNVSSGTLAIARGGTNNTGAGYVTNALMLYNGTAITNSPLTVSGTNIVINSGVNFLFQTSTNGIAWTATESIAQAGGSTGISSFTNGVETFRFDSRFGGAGTTALYLYINGALRKVNYSTCDLSGGGTVNCLTW